MIGYHWSDSNQCPSAVIAYALIVGCTSLTLHVHNQQCVADSQRGPEPEGFCCREEVSIDDRHRGHYSHRESDDHGLAQHGQQAVAWCQETDADAAVALGAVELEQGPDMAQQERGASGQEPAEGCGQDQAEPAVGRPLVEEVQAAAQGASQRELALD